jgi:hypothetical protein
MSINALPVMHTHVGSIPSVPSHVPTCENPYLHVGFTRAGLPVTCDNHWLRQVIQMLQPSGFRRHDTVHVLALNGAQNLPLGHLKTVLIPKTNLNYESKQYENHTKTAL